MPALSPNQIEQIVNQIAALLLQRERAVYAVRQDELARGLAPSVYVRHAHLHIQQPTAAFMTRLAALDGSDLAVNSVLDAWSYGIKVHISLHRQLLPLLPVQPLSVLPLTLSDHLGVAVHLCGKKVIGYRDVADLLDGVLLLIPHAIVTALAADLLTQHHIHWIRPE